MKKETKEENIVIKEKKKVEELDEKSVKTASKTIIWLTVLGLGLTIFAILMIISLTLVQDLYAIFN